MRKLSVTHSTVRGDVLLTGSKSLANRFLIFTALAGSRTELLNVPESEDTRILKHCLDNSSEEVHAGDGGTTARFLLAYLCMKQGSYLLTGSERLQSRPMLPLIEALRTLGAVIECTGAEGSLPVRIQGGSVRGGKVTLDAGISSQFASALCMIAPFTEEGLELTLTGEAVSSSYLDMTLDMLRECYIHLEDEEGENGERVITIHKGTPVIPDVIKIENDWSSASYWYAAAALADKSDIFIPLLTEQSVQGDAVCVSLFDLLGVSTDFGTKGIEIRRTGDIDDDEFEYDFTECPDLAPTLAVVCAALGIPAVLSGLQTLKDKESDRLNLVASNLQRMGIQIRIEDESEWHIQPSALRTEGVVVETQGDHRIAMAFTPLVLRGHSLIIDNPDCVVKSYPGFWTDVENCYKTIEFADS
jgi:3-phosphoshikimate 1-carboxyvinyltransferase